MAILTRRSLLRSSAGLVAAEALARPRLARAAATTATVWWVQGFAREEDIAFEKLIADYQKASGNRIDFSIVPFAPLRQKIVSAFASGAVPDLVNANPAEIVTEYAWQGKLVDVSDVVDTQKAQYSATALLSAHCYNNLEKRRSFYGVPVSGAVIPVHIWRPLVEKAGYKISDIPKTWDAFCDFFKPVQDKLRRDGLRGVYAFGFQVTTNGVDPNGLFNYFLIAHGGKDIVTPDGKLHLDDPQVKQAAIRTLDYLTTAYKQGYVPPGAINWNDADDNAAFHARRIVMDFDGTISTEVALIGNKTAYDRDIVTMGLPLDNAGKPVPAQVEVTCALIPQGAKNVAVARELAKYMIEPRVNDTWLKTGLGRFLPVMPAIARNDPFWLDPNDPHRPPYVREGVLGPTLPSFWAYNPAYAEVRTMEVWGRAMADIVRRGTMPQAAADKAFQQIEAIFAKYPMRET